MTDLSTVDEPETDLRRCPSNSGSCHHRTSRRSSIGKFASSQLTDSDRPTGWPNQEDTASFTLFSRQGGGFRQQRSYGDAAVRALFHLNNRRSRTAEGIQRAYSSKRIICPRCRHGHADPHSQPIDPNSILATTARRDWNRQRGHACYHAQCRRARVELREKVSGHCRKPHQDKRKSVEAMGDQQSTHIYDGRDAGRQSG
jgi:hypothetical protein